MSHHFLQKILGYFFPSFCLGCKKEDAWICKDCLQKLVVKIQQICPLCLQDNEWGYLCYKCKDKNSNFGLNGVFAAYHYKDQSLLPLIIHNFKYSFMRDLAEPLGDLFIEATKDFIIQFISNQRQNTVLCPVPLHSKRLKWRGFNQAELLSQHLGTYFNIPTVPLLKRTHFAKTQQSLGREKRLMNVNGAFEYNSELFIKKPTRVLLIDDVATTLATLEACARPLKAAGIEEIYGMVLARAQ